MVMNNKKGSIPSFQGPTQLCGVQAKEPVIHNGTLENKRARYNH